jgi:hypothetical protein
MKKSLVAIILIVLGIAAIFTWVISSSPRENIGKTADEKVLPKAKSSRPPMVKSEAFTSKREELRALLKEDNAPIEFYGVVVDESGKPLEGVEVQWNIVKSGSFAPSLGLATGASGSMLTTNDGRFTLKNETGSTLGIKSLSKAGYHEVNGTVRSYGYGSTPEPHQPDQLNPVKYVMIRDGGTRAVKKQIPLRFDWDGTNKEIPISLPERSEVMVLTPEIIGQKANSQDYDWRIKIQIKNAQLVSGKIGDARLAPIDGYRPEIKLQSDVEGQRGSEANALIYFKTEDNRFGEIRFSAYSDRGSSDNTGNLSIRWNPDGGRVFE